MKKLLPVCLLIWSCQTSEPAREVLKKHQKAIGDISQINTINTLAECTGPDGAYTTYTESSFQDDYLLFLQDYGYKPNPFYALILDKATGFGLDTSMTSRGPLSDPVVAVLKAHEFHEILLQPEDRYFNMSKLEDTVYFGQRCNQLIASDHLGLPVRLYFDKKTSLMAGFSQSNPYKKGEVISIHFKNWDKESSPVIFRNLVIHQGDSDHFRFDYQYVTWNHPDFEKLNPN